MADLYRTIFERSRHPMAVVDDEGVLRDVNEALVAYVGISRGSLAGGDRRELLEPGAVDEVTTQQHALREGHAWVGRYRLDGPEHGPVVDVCAEPDVTPGRHLVVYASPDEPPEPEDSGVTGAVGAAAAGVRLTPRELEVVGDLALGATSPQIAERLVVSEHTVRTHVRNAMERTGARTRAHLVVIAMRAGLVGDALERLH